MKVFIKEENKTVNMTAKTGDELLKKLDLNPFTVLVIRNGELVAECVKFKPSDEIEIIDVISKG